MIWLTWRQFRIQAAVGLAALAAMVVALMVTGPHLASLYADSGIKGCTPADTCDHAIDAFNAQIPRSTGALYFIAICVLYVTPAMIGVFWGAPLVARELEAGTHRLVWNQSITSSRWLAVKLALVGLAAMTTAGLFSFAVTWWATPIDRARMDRITPMLFGARGIVPIGYAAFAFALGVAIGLLIRRSIPAMAVTLILVVAALSAMPLWIRPHLATPVHTITAFDPKDDKVGINITSDNRIHVTAEPNIPGAWVLSNNTLAKDGREFTGPPPQACLNAGPRECVEAIRQLGLRQSVTYQPASNYWTLQRNETVIFLAVATALAGFCFWWTRRRLT